MNYTISIWLKNVRRMRGFTLEEVSQRLNGMVTKQAISKYERGLMKPSPVVMDALCKLYQAFPDFSFGTETRCRFLIYLFRSKEPVPQKVKQRIISEVQIWMGALFWLWRIFFDAMTSF